VDFVIAGVTTLFNSPIHNWNTNGKAAINPESQNRLKTIVVVRFREARTNKITKTTRHVQELYQNSLEAFGKPCFSLINILSLAL
jgi:hypothetical protein